MIRLVITDVDGTLVQTDKSLAPSTIAAVGRLRDAGIPLGIVSARPPFGLKAIVDTLSLHGLLAGFNGGVVTKPDGTVVERRLLPPPAAQQALALFAKYNVSAWFFTETEWLTQDPNGPRVLLERHTINTIERVVSDFTPYQHECGKLVGVTDDEPLLGHIETELQTMLGATANAKRSQPYYLDVTHLEANKGNAVRTLAGQFGLALSEVAVLGDQANDVPMFKVAGTSICMGNGPPDVQAQASLVTGRNDQDGWAHAIDTFILPRAAA